MTWLIIAVLILIGLILLVLEILVVPGTTIVGILGFGSMVVAIWKAYTLYGSTAGHICLGLTLLLTLTTIYFTLKSKTWNRLALKDELSHRVDNLEGLNLKPGDTGRSVSRIAPSGKASFNDHFVEVHSMGDFIDHESPIIIVKIEGPKIFVKLNT